jgi:transposase
MAMRKREEDEVFPNAAGIDVGGSSHWVAVPRQADEEPVREFGSMTDDLNAMADWLLSCGVDTVAPRRPGSTGSRSTRCWSGADWWCGWSMHGR